MINSVRNTVLAIANKHNFGYVPISDFNLFCKQAQLEIFEEMFELLPREWFNQAMRTSGSGYANRVQNIIQQIEYFSSLALMDATSGGYLIPSDCYYLNNVQWKGSNADKVSFGKLLDLKLSNDTAPTDDNPMYAMIGQKITVAPIDPNFQPLAEYIRYPLDPKWTYVSLSAGEPLFDQSASDYQDFELGLDYFPDLVIKILSYIGISIDRQMLLEYSQTEQMMDKQQTA